MKGLTALFLLTVVVCCGGLDVTDMCSRCSCQYLASSHLTDTVCTSDHPVLEVNCTAKPKVRQNPNQFLNAPTPSNESVVVWLSYRHAGLTSLPALALYQPFNVSLLALDHNRLVYLPPRALSPLANLTILTASHNDLRSVAPDAFSGMRRLRHVDLSHNSLHTLDFLLVADAPLVSLDLQDNTLKSLGPPARNMPTLELLDLSLNHFPDFPLGFFSSFPNLRQLNVSHTGLAVLTADLFHDLADLKVLDVSGNLVKSVDEKVVDRMRSLSRLYLSGNALSDVDFVEVIPSLRTLDVSGNNLSSLGERLLSEGLQRLVVSHNNLTDLSHVFKVFPKLKSLDAGWNPCAVFPEHVRTGLRELLLDGTLLSSWPAQTPGEGGIDHLSLSHIPAITTLGPFAFSGILKPKNESGKCASLKISNTSLSAIDEDAFRNLDICKLDLSYNKLRWLPESLVPWGSLVGADLQGNPWHCDCALQWMLSSVVPAAYRADQSLLEDLRCGSPEEVAGMRLVHWYNRGSASLCQGAASLAAKPRVAGDSVAVTLASSPLMLACLLVLGVLAGVLVSLAFALQRRQTRMRRLRRNRRF